MSGSMIRTRTKSASGTARQQTAIAGAAEAVAPDAVVREAVEAVTAEEVQAVVGVAVTVVVGVAGGPAGAPEDAQAASRSGAPESLAVSEGLDPAPVQPWPCDADGLPIELSRPAN